MTASFNLLLALFLLAPGFGAFAGVYVTGLRRPFRPAPPAPGSLLALALVTVGALVTHATAAWLYVLKDVACATFAPCLAVDFDPNPYSALLSLRRPEAAGAITATAVAALLSALTVVAAIGYLFGAVAVRLALRAENVRSLLYGWTEELLREASTAAHLINAFVITDVSADGVFAGYEGMLVDLRLTADGRIQTVTLKSCERFVLLVEAERMERRSMGKAPIPLLVLEGENIHNIAFDIYVDLDRVTVEDLRKLPPSQRAEIKDAIAALGAGSD